MGDDSVNTRMKNKEGGLPGPSVLKHHDIDIVDIDAIVVDTTAIW